MTNPKNETHLLSAARQGDVSALDGLLSLYKPLVKAKAAAYYILGGDRDDLIQEGMIGLYKAFLDYNPQKNPVFSAFASLCISRQILTAIKSAARQKHQPLNSSLSLQSIGTDDSDDTPPGIKNDPESLFISRELSSDITTFIRKNLSALEYNVIMLHMEGLNQSQIAATLNKPKKSVDNSLQRARKKVENMLCQKAN